MPHQTIHRVHKLEEHNLDRLEDICSEYKYLLLDTSALQSIDSHHPPKSLRSGSFLEMRIRNYSDQREFLDFLIESISNYRTNSPFYFTPLIFEEIEKSNDNYFHYKKKLKKSGRVDNRRKLDLFRMIESSSKRRRRFTEICKEKERIITLNSAEAGLFDSYKRYFSYTTSRFNLSDADFEFLVYGGVLAYARGSTALVSNDIKLLCSWTEVLKKLKIFPERLGFFIRRDFPYLERASLNPPG